MKTIDLIERTKTFAVETINFVASLKKDSTTSIIAKQLIRSATSVGANYRAACHAKSYADFIAKLGIVEEEADECIYWLELLSNKGIVKDKIDYLIDEARQLVRITISSIKTAKARQNIYK